MSCELLIGSFSDGTVVSLVGRGTMCESPAFREVAERLLDKGTVVFDASRCDYLDSTFLGCLIGIKKACEQIPKSRFLIAASADTRLKLFCTSSLHQFFDFLEECPKVLKESSKVDLERPDERELGYHVMRCHKRLAEMGGHESDTFQAIADRLAKELGGKVSVE